MNLHQIDLNLLVLFDALYRHQSVSKAANEICLSQSAFSHALARLRQRLNDDLFIRINNVMQPTSCANELAKQLEIALPIIAQAIKEPATFNPKSSKTTFRLTATDYTEFSLLPKLSSHLAKVAPNIQLKVLPAQQPTPTMPLDNSDVDFTLGFTHQVFSSSIIEHYTWLTDSYCTIARKGHPALSNGLNLDTYLEQSHLRIAPWGENKGIVDQQLDKLKLKRHVALQLPSLMAAPHIVAQSDHLLSMPKKMAEQLAGQLPINIYQTPLHVPNYHLNIYWRRIDSNKAHIRWLCDEVKKIFK